MSAIENSSNSARVAGPFGDGDEDDGPTKRTTSGTINNLVGKVTDFLLKDGRGRIITILAACCIMTCLITCGCKSLDAFLHYDDGDKKVDTEIHTTGRAETVTETADIIAGQDEIVVDIPVDDNNRVLLAKDDE